MNKYVMPRAIALVALTLAAPAAAQNITADLDRIAEVMQGEGLQAKIEREDDGRPYLLSGISGYTFVVNAFGCNDAWADCKFVQFRAAFTPETKPTLAEVNQYSADNFFGRYYLDDENDPVIEMDIDLEAGGMSKELFIDNIAYWDMALSKFGEFAFSKDK